MNSAKYRNEHHQPQFGHINNAFAQRCTTPPPRAASPGASASGLVMHRDTQQMRSPIATPQGSWIALTPGGGMEILNKRQYICLLPPRIPQPLLPAQAMAIPQPTRGFAQLRDDAIGAYQTLRKPSTPPIFAQQEPVRHQPPSVQASSDENKARALRLQSSTPMPSLLQQGLSIPVASLRSGKDRVEDPQRPGQYISRRTLQERANRVEDPQQPGRMISRNALRKRGYKEPDPRRPGHLIGRYALHARDNKVEDPQKPGHMVTRRALKKRELDAKKAAAAAANKASDHLQAQVSQ